MKMPLNKKIIGLVILFTLITITIVKASIPYAISIKSKDISEYPRVVLEMSISGDYDTYYPRDFKIFENGERNMGPMVFLEPSQQKDSVELRILLDNSGNTKKYEAVIKSNIKALTTYIDSQVSSFKLIIDTFGGSETSLSINSLDKLYLIDQINFSNTQVTEEYSFSKLNELVIGSSVSTEKIALIINGGRFSTDGINDATAALANNGYKTFVCGYPVASLYPFKPENILAWDISIFNGVHGGFIGLFNTDLSIIYDLIKKTYSGNYVMHYYTNNSTDKGGASEIYIDDYKAETISLSAPGLEEPIITSGLSSSVIKQTSLPINIRIDPKTKMVNGIMMKFYDGEKIGFQGLLRSRNDDEGVENLYIGEINIPQSIINASYEDEYTGKYVRYFVTAHTPYTKITTQDFPTSIPVLLYDEDITFYHQVVNGGEQVIWNWEKAGAKKFEVWAGNERIRSASSEKKIILDANECNKYPIIKVRASSVSNPSSSDWGYFSKPMEIFLDQDGFITEKDALDIMINCIDSDKKEVTSVYSLIGNDPDYSGISNITMERMLYYITGIVQSNMRDKMTDQKYSLIYYLINFLNSEEYDLYKNDGEIQKSLLYKIITNVNQITDLEERFNTGLDELSIRNLGYSLM